MLQPVHVPRQEAAAEGAADGRGIEDVGQLVGPDEGLGGQHRGGLTLHAGGGLGKGKKCEDGSWSAFCYKLYIVIIQIVLYMSVYRYCLVAM